MSSIIDGSIFVLSIQAYRTCASIQSGFVKFRPPLFLFVKGVRTAATITTSLSCLTLGYDIGNG